MSSRRFRESQVEDARPTPSRSDLKVFVMDGFLEADLDDTVEELKRKYLKPRAEREVHSGTSKQPCSGMKGYSGDLQDLDMAVTNPSELSVNSLNCHGSDEQTRRELLVSPLQESQAESTETDVTLPSNLNGSSGSPDACPAAVEAVGHHAGRQLMSSYCDPSTPDNVCHVMMTIYKQLKAERLSQQQLKKELRERERRLELREQAPAGLGQVVHTHRVSIQEKHQEELSQMQNVLGERDRENRRLQSSFHTLKELYDGMKKQLNEISSQNHKLESQYKRVQARLENLQRKSEYSAAPNVRHSVCVKCAESVKAPGQERTAVSGKARDKVNLSPPHLGLLSLLLEWVLDGLTFPQVAGDKVGVLDKGLPEEVMLIDRFVKALPLLAEQLHQTPSSEPQVILHVLRLIYQALRHIETSTQRVSLSSILRRIGAEVSKSPAQPPLSHSDNSSCLPGSRGRGTPRGSPLYHSPCPHTRILSALITLRTVTKADLLAQVLDSLHSELKCEESAGLFLHYGGVCVLFNLLKASRGGLQTPIDILMQLAVQSRFLAAFLEACSCADFFCTISQLIKSPRLELPSLEKLSILLQKLSTIRKNRRLFETSSLHVQLQDLRRTADPARSFLCLNLSSILLNLK